VKRRKARIIKEPKAREEWGESVFMVRAVEHGLPVSRPWGESNSFDFVVGKPGRFVSVQVKSTTVKNGGGYLCSVRQNAAKYARGAFDFLAAYVIQEDVWYIIPAKKVAGMGYVTLCSNSGEANFEEYREAWHLLREAVGMSEETVARDPEERADEGEEELTGPTAERMQNMFDFMRRRLGKGGRR
jgi:PD-(D/E)XK nuclease superfamily protein